MTDFFNHYRDLPSTFYSSVSPSPLYEGSLIHHNLALAKDLNLSLSEKELQNFTTGTGLPNGCDPIAQKYTGHQFGYYNPDLGDGRGLLLGQCYDAKQQLWDFHLKGAGQTPYSRRGDGRAVLRSAIREYLGGEALHALGIASTRCLSLASSREGVQREVIEPRASYLRVAKTHVRFGHFEWLAQQADWAGFEQLTHYVIETLYPDLKNAENPYASLLTRICQQTAKMVAQWQGIGFCHGVMNTDNFSVSGETFDFGPYAFMDDFKIHFVCNHSDTEGRYAYSQQPNIGLWNCQVLATCFSHFISQEETDNAINAYVDTFNQAYLEGMLQKLGLHSTQAEDRDFVGDTLILLDQSDYDFQHFFLKLADYDSLADTKQDALLGQSKAWQAWSKQYFSRRELEADTTNFRDTILQHTPQFLLRNYINQDAIEAAEKGNYELLEHAFAAVQSPFEQLADLPKAYYQPPQRPDQKGFTLSCSS